MTFDNQKFENGVKTTINSLDKLKSSLKLEGAAKGLSQVEKAANGMSFGGLSRSVEAIAGRFSTLGVIGVTALQNITNQAIATGERMLKALTIDPVSTGFSEYETKMNAIQTIMSNTASKGTTMAQITATLDELNTYADKTIYNFAEMTRNIGTFTAAGIGLKDAATSIQGIANLAAASGSTSQQASTAMYQLSQALAAGTVKLMDWNSVVNAGMGGEKFQEALKATAREYGISVDAIIEKNGSFRESLQEGWITADVLNDTLKKFTVEGAKEYSEAMMRSGKYTREQADALVAEAKAMEDAATKVKTWTQLWDTLKESAQSGWSQSWEYIAGNFLEARDFFTEASEVIGSVISQSAEARNSLLDGALTSNWTKLTRTINESGNSVDAFEQKIKELAISGGYDVARLIEDYGSLEKAIRSGEIPVSILKDALRSFGKITTEVDGKIVDLTDTCLGLVDSITQTSGRELLLDSIMNGVKGIIKISGTAKEAFNEIFEPMTPERLSGILSSIHEFSKKLIIGDETADRFKRTCKGLFAVFDIGVSSVKEVASGALNLLFPALGAAGGDILDLTANAGDAIVAFRDWIEENNVLGKGIEYVSSGIRTMLQLSKEWFSEIKNMPEVQAVTEKLGKAVDHSMEYFKGGKQTVLDFISGVKDLDKIDLNTAKAVLKDFSNNVLGYFFNLDRITNGAKKLFQSTKTAISGFVSYISGKLGIAKEKIGAFFDFLSDKFSGIGFAEVMLVGFSAAMIGLGVSIAKALKVIKGGFLGIGDVFDSVSGAFNAIKFNFQVKAFATMIATLVGALALMTTLDQEKLESSAWVLGIFAGALIGVMTTLSVLQHFKLLDDFQSNAMAIVALSASLAIMVAALKGMEYIDKTAIGQSLFTLAALMSMMLLFAGLLGKFVPKLTSGSVTLVAYAAAVLILAEAMAKLSAIPSDRVASAIVSLAVLMGAMSVLALAAKKTGIGSAVTMIAMVLTLNALVSAFDRIKMVDVNSIMANLEAFQIIFGTFIALMVASKFSGKNASKAGIGILAMSVSLLIIADAFKKIAKLSPSDATKAMVVVNLLFGVFAGITAVTKYAGDNAAKAGVTILAMAAGVTILCGAIRLLSGLDGGDLAKATGVIVALGFVLGGIILCTHLAQKANGTLIVITGCIFALSMVVGFLSMVNPEGLMGAVTAIGILGLVLGGILVATKFAGKANVALLTATACVWALSKILEEMSELEVQDALSNSAALSLLLISMSAMMAVLQHVPAAGAAHAAVAILAGLGTITAVVLALGAISELCGDYDLFGKGAEVLGTLGTAIGSFLGNIVGSFSAGAASGLPQIGDDLKAFATSLSAIPEGAGDGAKSLATALASMTGASFLEGLLTLGANDSVDKFSEQVPKIGKALADFANSISGLDESSIASINTATTAASSLVALSNEIPKTNGLIQFLIGVGDLGTFAEDLTAFGMAMKSYSIAVQGLDTEAISISVTAANSLVSLAKTVPGITTVWDRIGGGKGDLGTFASRLRQFGTAIKTYGETVDGLNVSAIDISIEAANKLVTLSGTVPAITTIWDHIGGGKGDLGTFGSDLSSFGRALNSYSRSVIGLDLASIEQSVSAAELLKTMSENMPTISTLWDKIGGGKGDLGTFGADLVTFGNYLSMYASSVSNIDTESLGATMDSVQRLINMASGLSGIDFTSFAGFGESLAVVAETGIEGFITAFTEAEPQIQTAAANAITVFVTGMESKIGQVNNTARSIANGAVSAISSRNSEWTNVGYNAAAGFAQGIRNGTYIVVSAAEAMAAAALSAAKSELNQHSPSKEFEHIGMYNDEGMAIGMLKYVHIVTSASETVAGAAIDSMNASLSRLSRVLSTELSSTPTIRPVLDLSDVDSGIRKMDRLFSGTLDFSVGTTLQNARAVRIGSHESNTPSDTTPTETTRSVVNNFTQNNYSPKALSRIEIYRQTNNLFSATKEVLSKA